MTSPTQLKYLNAMGIPVWVSRDLVIEEILSIEPPLAQTLTSSSNEVLNKLPETQTNKKNHSARSILDSLESNSKNKSAPKQQFDNNTVLNESIEDSVKIAKLPSETLVNKKGTSITSTETQNLDNLLFQSPSHYVYATGCKNPDWMVLGHSPEAFNGIGQEPFAGDAGELLNNMLRATGVQQPREQTYILNVIDKDQATDTNNTKHHEEQLKLRQELRAIIDDIQPRIILFVGQKAAQNLLECNDPLIIMRSKVHTLSNTNIPCVVTYYPSYLLQKLTDKRKAWNDLKLAMSLLNDQDPKNR